MPPSTLAVELKGGVTLWIVDPKLSPVLPSAVARGMSVEVPKSYVWWTFSIQPPKPSGSFSQWPSVLIDVVVRETCWREGSAVAGVP